MPAETPYREPTVDAKIPGTAGAPTTHDVPGAPVSLDTPVPGASRPGNFARPEAGLAPGARIPRRGDRIIGQPPLPSTLPPGAPEGVDIALDPATPVREGDKHPQPAETPGIHTSRPQRHQPDMPLPCEPVRRAAVAEPVTVADEAAPAGVTTQQPVRRENPAPAAVLPAERPGREAIVVQERPAGEVLFAPDATIVARDQSDEGPGQQAPSGRPQELPEEPPAPDAGGQAGRPPGPPGGERPVAPSPDPNEGNEGGQGGLNPDESMSVIVSIAEEIAAMRAEGTIGRTKGKTSQTAALTQALRERIASGVLPAGTILPPADLIAEKIGVSTMIVHEARTTLADEDLLQTKPGHGTVVTGPDVDVDTIQFRESPKHTSVLTRIRNLPSGFMVPGNRDLVSELGVERITVTRVLQELEANGEIVRQDRRWFKKSEAENPNMQILERLLQLPTQRGEILRLIAREYNVPGEILPSFKELVDTLGVGIGDVIKAIGDLKRLGFVETKLGRNGGTTLLESLPPIMVPPELVKEDLYGLIEAGTLSPNQLIPSAADLAQNLFANLNSINFALNQFEAEGLLSNTTEGFRLTITEADRAEIILTERIKDLNIGESLPSQDALMAEFGIESEHVEDAYERLHATGQIDAQNRLLAQTKSENRTEEE